MRRAKQVSFLVSFILFNERGAMLIENRDDMHLGPEAMKMIGEGIAKDVVKSGGRLWGFEDPSSSNQTNSSEQMI